MEVHPSYGAKGEYIWNRSPKGHFRHHSAHEAFFFDCVKKLEFPEKIHT